ncbi:hypothetical protein HK101_006843 [Irineochytrium annulatum]|nr:hypothetical protein HK101_006843 [Irineochytrium annulatum]
MHDSDVTLRQLDAAVPPLVLDRQSPAVRDRQPYTPESGGWADSTMDSHHPADDQTYYRTEQSVGFVRPSFDPIVMMLTEINSEHTAYIPFPDALSWPDSLSITPETLQGYAPNIRVPSSPNQHLLPPPPRITDVDVDIVDRYLNHTKNGSTCRAWEIVPVFSYFRIANPGLRYTMCAAAAFALNPQPPEPIARRYFLKARHFLVSSLGENTSLDGREGILQLQVLIMITSLAKSMADISTGTSVHRLQSLFRRSLKLDEEEKADIIHDPWLMVARRRAWRVCLLVDYTLVVLTNGRFDELAGGFVRIAMPREVEFDEDRRIYWLTGLLYIQAKVWDVVRVSRLSWDIIGADDVEVSLDEWREKNVLLGVCEVELEGCRRCIMKGGWKGTFDGDEILRSVEKRIAMGLKTTLRWDLILPFAAYHASVCLIWLARAKLESRPRRWECAMKGEASAMAIVDVLTLILRCVDENGAPIPSGAKDGNAWDEEAGSTGSVGTQDGPRKGTVVWDSIYQLPAFACLASANLLFEIIKAKREIVGDMEGGHERLEELEGVRLRCQMGIRANVLSLRRFKRTVRIIEKWEMQAAAMMERC